MGASMSDVRSRTGVAAVTAGALVLLALPVVAEGQVPVVDQVVGGVTRTVQSVTEPSAPAAPLPAPAARPPSAPAPAASSQRSTPARPQPAPTRTPTASSGASGTEAGDRASTSSSNRAGDRQTGARAASSSARNKAGARASASADDDAAAAQQDDGGDSAGSSGDGVANVGGDAAARLPFTGLELLLVAMAGLGMLAGGALIRNGTRHTRV